MRGLVFIAGLAWALSQVPALAADVPAGTQLAPDPDLERPERTYQSCLLLTAKQPDKAIELASKWIVLGGGEAARHCQALALIALKDYGEGATRLEELAKASKQAPLVRANMLAQAGQAWLLQDEPSRAYAAQSAALIIVPQGTAQHVELLLDRAGTLADAGKYDEVLNDVDAALKIQPNNAEAIAFRASAFRSMGKIDDAMAEAERAVGIAPDNVAALLERGNLYRLKRRLPEARKDWLHILEVDPDSAAADAARTNIEHMDVDTRAR